MSDDKQEVFPTRPAGGAAPDPAEPVFLEGMKVLFDEKVGLYPVSLVARKRKPVKEPR